jgi:hypothetical protein
MKQLTPLVPSEDLSLCPGKHFLLAGFNLCPLEIAVYAKWFEGLEYLLQKGGDAAHALRGAQRGLEAASLRHSDSRGQESYKDLFRLVLRDDLPNAIPMRISPCEEDFYLTSIFAVDEFHSVLALDVFPAIIRQETYKRREKLRSLWVREGSPGTISPTPSSKKPLDAAAGAVFNILRNRQVDIPRGLDPGTASIWHCKDWSRSRVVNSAVRDEWFRNGFVDIDSPGQDGKTPLGTIMNKWWRCPSKCDLRHALWLFRKGAYPSFTQDELHGCPNMLFYFAVAHALGCKLYSEKHAALTQEDIALFASCDRLATDSCKCYCSEAGCLPGVERLNSNRNGRGYPLKIGESWAACSVEVNFVTLNSWQGIIGLTQSQHDCYTESWMRQEVFQLLAMTHTCDVWNKTGVRATPARAVLEEIQIFEGLQLILLEVFMEAFRAEGIVASPSKFVPAFPTLLSQWLAKLDSIFSTVGQPPWRIVHSAGLYVTWYDVLDKRGLEDSTSRTGLRTSERAHEHDKSHGLDPTLPGA